MLVFKALIHFVIIVCTFLILTMYVPGFYVSGWVAAAIAALVFGLVNATIGPILTFFSLPLIFITLGIFWFVLNALLLTLVAFLVPGFRINGFTPALIGSVVLALVNLIWKRVSQEKRESD
jgi:putative membrane protein